MKKAIIWILIVLLLLGGGATVYYLFSIGAIGFELPEATDPAKCDLIALYSEPTEPVTEPVRVRGRAVAHLLAVAALPTRFASNEALVVKSCFLR